MAAKLFKRWCSGCRSRDVGDDNRAPLRVWCTDDADVIYQSVLAQPGFDDAWPHFDPARDDQVVAATLHDEALTVELAEEALRGVVVQHSRQVSVSEIMGLVTEEFSISARDMIGKSRTQAISLPRQISMYLCRQLTDQSLEEVGRYFGGRDHTTVLYAVKKIEKRVKDDKMFRELVSTLTTRLQG